MNGTGGLKGWRWLFIFDGIISIPIASLGLWLIPDAPANTRAFYLKPIDREIAQARMDRYGRAKSRGFSWEALRKTVTHWPMWVLVTPYV